MLSQSNYIRAIELTQVVSVDTLLRNNQGAYLLGFRNNRPAQNTWFVPGGRVFKEEKITDAPMRILRTELGHMAENIFNIRFNRVSDHIYPDNFAGTPNVGTHYVCTAVDCDIDCDSTIMPETEDDQHQRWRWMTPQQILASPEVHQLTKFYFMPNAPNTF